MSQSEHTHRAAPASVQEVRDAVAQADRRRRIREGSRRLWRAAPIVAASALLVAAATRWAHWSVAFPVVALALGFGGVAVYWYVGRRHHAVTDIAATEIDTDAGLRGELRSASWFAGRETRDQWADLHLERAAARLHGTDWSELYPMGRSARSRVATSVMVIATVALVVMTFTGRHALSGSDSPKPPAPPPGRPVALAQDDRLPPELPKELEDLLKATEAGTLSADATAAASTAQMRDLLAQLAALHDPQLLKALAEAMAKKSGSSSLDLSQKLKELSDRMKQASDKPMTPPDIKKGLDDLAKQLSDIAKSQQMDELKDPDGGTPSDKSKQEDSGNGEAGDDAAGGSMQFSKDPAAGSEIAVVLSSTESEPSSDMSQGVGVGGVSGARPVGGTMADIEQALRQETVEASSDNSTGENVITTGERKKTEHGNATVTFTRGAEGASDRSRTAARPPVPEARRTGVQTYFIRKQ